MASFFGYLVAKIRNVRFSIQNRTSSKSLIFGAIYSSPYRNFKRDPVPLFFCMYSGTRVRKRDGATIHYTHGLNIHYFDYNDKLWLSKVIYSVKKGGQVIDGFTFYKMLKLQRPQIPQKAYRAYFTKDLASPKIVSAGFTALDKLAYPFNDPWIQSLNNLIQPSELNYTNIRIAYSSTELSDRVAAAQNSVPLSRSLGQSATTSATSAGTTSATSSSIKLQ